MANKYDLPLAASVKQWDGVQYKTAAEKRYLWVPCHIVNWCNDADGEPVAVYVNDRTGEVGYDCVHLFSTLACPPDPNIKAK